ncbi:hypothetical protein [Pedobacter miscanthi]|jgi:hypothetical protein|uniref:hypothetical protein n=1 Tax=Pedobacter miscanthi TaxID=2259170 RepID=UPI00292DF5D7|nr:hypothetical protein [Pedobacter miscanthi]
MKDRDVHSNQVYFISVCLIILNPTGAEILFVAPLQAQDDNDKKIVAYGGTIETD